MNWKGWKLPKPKTTQPLSTGLKGLLELNRPAWLANVVDAYLVNSHDVKTRVDPGWFHPSSLSNPCDAFMAFDFVGAPKRTDADPRNIRILDHGHNRDQAWKTYLAGANLSILDDSRKPCEKCGAGSTIPKGKRTPIGVDGRHMCIPELRIRGECDDIVRHPQTGRLYIEETKTKNDALFKAMEGPDPEHVIQTHCYMVGHGIDRTLIVYENSNNKDVKVFEVEYNADTWAGIKSRVELLLYQMSNDLVPERRPGKYESRCNYFPICSMANFPALVDAYREKAGLK